MRAGLLLLALALVAGRAAADEASSARNVAAAKRAAREHYDKGLALYHVADYPGAEAEFRAALALADAPELLFNLAQCARNLGDHARALELYHAFLERKPDAENRAKVEEYLAEERRLAAPPLEHHEVVAQPAPPPPPPAPAPKPRSRRALWIGVGVGAAALVVAGAAVALGLLLAPSGTDLGVHDLAPLVRF